MKGKEFYEKHKNFSARTLSEYYLSPGIKCKFDIIKSYLENRTFENGIDLGCSGNSFLYFLENVYNKSFFDLANTPLTLYSCSANSHPINGNLTTLPYRDKSFDLVSALDVLEHINDDELAISEISRVLIKGGIAIITVPHRMKYFTSQDRLIGHYRRYEINKINILFKKYSLKNIRTFGVYGRLMKIADIQSSNPKRLEESLQNLRSKYDSDVLFRKIWNKFIQITSRMMKIDAKFQPIKKIMNIGLIFIKN